MPAVPCGELNWQLRQDSNRSQVQKPSGGGVLGIRLSVSILVQNESFSWRPKSNRRQLGLIHQQLKVGPANQRHPLSLAAILLSRNPQ